MQRPFVFRDVDGGRAASMARTTACSAARCVRERFGAAGCGCAQPTPTLPTTKINAAPRGRKIRLPDLPELLVADTAVIPYPNEPLG